MRRPAVARVILAIVITATLAWCALLQAASDALAKDGAAPGSLPTHLPRALGVAVYRAFEHVSHPAFVEQTLAQQALADGDLNAAHRYAVRMGDSPWRDEVLAQIAERSGDAQLAYEYYYAAADVDAVQRRIDVLANSDPQTALHDEEVMTAHLASLTTHPDAVADGYYRQGLLHARLHDGEGARRCYERAMELSPLNMTYLLSDANQAIVDGHLDDADALFKRALATIDPRSADAYAGRGLVALRRGRRAAALQFAATAREQNPQSADLGWLERELR